MKIKERFNNFLPIVVDLETGGINAYRNPILEFAWQPIFLKNVKDKFIFYPGELYYYNVKPFNGCVIDNKALSITNIFLEQPRYAIFEKEALNIAYKKIKQLLNKFECKQAILVGHNSFFDLNFLRNADRRCQIRSPFHSFCTIDTVSLGAIFLGETVLSNCCKKAGLDFNDDLAHNASYDCNITAKLFCNLLNKSTVQEIALI